MMRPRVIPCLLLKNRGLVKTVQFRNPTYVGDPINAVRIFNDKEVDELIFLDITASIERRPPPFEFISKIAGECFMPLSYGGGIRTLEDIKTIISLGVEKVCINSHAVENPAFIRAAADLVGSSSVVVALDVKKNARGQYEVFTYSGTRPTGLDPVQLAVEMEKRGAGELLLNSIDRDGTMQGYDIELIRQVADAVSVPVIACGGAGNISDLARAVQEGKASAVAAGSMFVFHGKHRAVLINFPTPQELAEAFQAPLKEAL
ncbi:MAG: AglZ/HisF2 family acetamidino modification protein [Nitrososphaerales archaeon]